MIEKKTIKLFGVAGSGKTTKCLELIQKYLKSYNISEIGFTTYTKAGIESIKEKLEENNIFLPDQNYFRTLHSLCWRLSEFKNKGISDGKFKEFCIKYEIPLGGDGEENKTIGEYIQKFYEFVQNIKVKQVSELTNKELNALLIEKYVGDDKINQMERDNIIKSLGIYIKWKKENNLYDYSDAFLHVLKNNIDLPVKVLIVDEAQDLYEAQIQIINMWTKKYSKDVFIISGDDDQAVHDWAGSDPSFLIEYENKNMEKIILEETHRCPKKITDLCNCILSEITYREPKKMIPLKSGGSIKKIYYPRNIFELISLLNKKETTFFLFRTNKLKLILANILFDQTNIPFSYIGGMTSHYSLKFCLIHNAIIKLSKKSNITFEQACKLIEVLQTKQLYRGIKTKFKEKQNISFISYEEFMTGILNWTLKIYDKNFDVKQELVKYIDYTKTQKYNVEKQLIREEIIKKKLLNSTNLIEYQKRTIGKKEIVITPLKLGTFHSSKGLQAENVFVFLGTNNYFSEMSDSEMRCLYVACSRTSNKLVTVMTDWGKEETYLADKFEQIYDNYLKNN